MTHNEALEALMAFVGMAVAMSFILFVYSVFAV
jgi:hypothetical protein